MSIAVISAFKSLYEVLDKSNLDKLSDVYADSILFEDPFHRIEGLKELTEYFEGMYQNVVAVDFDFGEVSEGTNHFHISWVMTLTHPKLNKGKAYPVSGCSFIRFNEQGLITHHRDYFDGGEMIYEQLPVIRKLVRIVKRQM